MIRGLHINNIYRILVITKTNYHESYPYALHKGNHYSGICYNQLSIFLIIKRIYFTIICNMRIYKDYEALAIRIVSIATILAIICLIALIQEG